MLCSRRISIAKVEEEEERRGEATENKLGTKRFRIQNHFIRMFYQKI